ncbi:ATP-binding cassette domain-containing protein [Paenibacillus sp. MBLB2552]|uniref:ATP-binding cassette domain-containing protein n=1 Tax=Paenibacillus mellifer TaxID=2937794 RepID=A0A9X1XUI6_9BACL|nr:ATP-binding cassette domain-containing protein [Paenibacillus mellifer]MCK8485820.1 ATP-binding cassette domain-containing protein [Paenibacillus mellifer]
MGNIIEVTGLKKSFGSLEAVKKVDFTVKEGSLFAFLGPNGAGKSTTIDIISTQLQPDAGEVIIDGYRLGQDDDRIRSSIGIVFQDSLLDPLLTVEENLQIRGRLYGRPRPELQAEIEAAAETAGVTEFLKRPYGKLSGGQRRRADIARALIHTPKVLFLDEPTTGLDPQTRKRVWEMVLKLQREQGMTVFLTTHYMEEAAQADYITIIDHGEVLAQGSPLELKNRYASDMLKIKPVNDVELTALLEELGLAFERDAAGIYHIALDSTAEALGILDRCRDNIANLEIVNGTMDDVFINLTGTEVRS